MITIKVSETLTIRTFEDIDDKPFFKIILQERAYLRQWVAWVDNLQTHTDVLNFILQGRQQIIDQKGLPMLILEDGIIVGGISMHSWNHDLKIAKIGYWLCDTAQGRGIMTKVAKAFLNYLFTQVKLHKVELEYFPENTRSAVLAQRLGFVVEGHLRDVIRYHGRYRNLIVCGMLQSEFKL